MTCVVQPTSTTHRSTMKTHLQKKDRVKYKNDCSITPAKSLPNVIN